jgi:uncharacterized protein YPO0396
MKDMVKDRLILLATAQEYMIEVADKLEQWENSQLVTEKYMFESMNETDKVLNLSREGSHLIKKMKDFCSEGNIGEASDQHLKLESQLQEFQNLFKNIMTSSAAANELSHRIESEAAEQKKMEEEIRNTLSQVSGSIESAVACAEIVLAEL